MKSRKASTASVSVGGSKGSGGQGAGKGVGAGSGKGKGKGVADGGEPSGSGGGGGGAEEGDGAAAGLPLRAEDVGYGVVACRVSRGVCCVRWWGWQVEARACLRRGGRGAIHRCEWHPLFY